MMSREAFLLSLHPLRQFLKLHDASLEKAIQDAHSKNPWFIPEFSQIAIHAIADLYLDVEKCRQWLTAYEFSSAKPKKVAIIMAGNVPLVGFHDLVCVLASGHHALIKLSEKDAVLSKFITDEWFKIEPSIASRITYTEKLEDFDAVVATGSNNSSRYFEYYFRNLPHILRRNRNGVAVINGNETDQELKDIAKDIFLYFGLGCRNISKIYVPSGYDFSGWAKAIEDWDYLKDHNKYRNNLDYNYAIYIINQVAYINLGHLILKEDDSIASRIGCVHYNYYSDKSSLIGEIESKRNEIQCIVSVDPIEGWDHIRPGQSQYPTLDQYADGVDTMRFLTSLID
ncbi:MAG TPA: acyl-CoA reductase [Saprospiraceae bacterium]|nr:acyl-CoA reductase [Saprospiraceae bacterium]